MGTPANRPIIKALLGLVSICVLVTIMCIGLYNLVFYTMKGYFDALLYAISLGIK